jgi:hypothetical protein
VNTDAYQIVALILQIAQAHNVTVPGGHQYNVPSENITSPTLPAQLPPQISYSTAAITGADDFNDGETTIKDLFDITVQITREVTPTCMFPIVGSYIYLSHLPRSESSRNLLASFVRVGGNIFRRIILTIASLAILRINGPPIPLSSFPRTALRSSRTQFSSSEIACVQPTTRTEITPRLITTIPRLTRSRRSQVRKRSQACSVMMPSWSSNKDLVTRPSPSSRLAPRVS